MPMRFLLVYCHEDKKTETPLAYIFNRIKQKSWGAFKVEITFSELNKYTFVSVPAPTGIFLVKENN